jgi:hypothetical protein
MDLPAKHRNNSFSALHAVINAQRRGWDPMLVHILRDPSRTYSTLEQHFCVIGQDLSSLPRFERGSWGYQATMDDKTRDEQVRRDPGVLAVEANRPLYAIEPHDVEVFESSEAFLSRAIKLFATSMKSTVHLSNSAAPRNKRHQHSAPQYQI